MSKYHLKETFENALISWANNVTSIPFIWAEQATAKKKTSGNAYPFGTLKIITPPQLVGTPYTRSVVGTESTFETVYEERFVLSANIFADKKTQHYMKLINDLARSMYRPDQISITQEAGLAVWNEPTTRDLTSILSTKYQYRAQADFDFAYKEAVQYDYYTIKTINGVGTVTTPTGNELELNFSATNII